jgi:ankyrin repeat protein
MLPPLYCAKTQAIANALLDNAEQKKFLNKPFGEFKKTPLHYAAMNGRDLVCHTLVLRGADLSVKDSYGRTALYLASQNGHTALVSLLLDLGANLHDVSNRNWSLLHAAAFNGHWSTCKLLLDRGIGNPMPTDTEWNPIDLAAQEGHLEVCELLLNTASGVDASIGFEMAIRKGHRDVVELFLLQGGFSLKWKTNDGGHTALWIASSAGKLDMVKFFIDNGADVNAVAKNGSTALYIAAQRGHFDVCRHLILEGADIFLKKDGEWTPLTVAAFNGFLNICELLIATAIAEVGEDDNDDDILDDKLAIEYIDDSRALSSACAQGHLDVVKMLVQWGADLNKPDSNGYTPLAAASNNGHVQIVKFLLNELDSAASLSAASLTVPASPAVLPAPAVTAASSSRTNWKADVQRRVAALAPASPAAPSPPLSTPASPAVLLAPAVITAPSSRTNWKADVQRRVAALAPASPAVSLAQSRVRNKKRSRETTTTTQAPFTPVGQAIRLLKQWKVDMFTENPHLGFIPSKRMDQKAREICQELNLSNEETKEVIRAVDYDDVV